MDPNSKPCPLPIPAFAPPSPMALKHQHALKPPKAYRMQSIPSLTLEPNKLRKAPKSAAIRRASSCASSPHELGSGGLCTWKSGSGQVSRDKGRVVSLGFRGLMRESIRSVKVQCSMFRL